MSSEFLNPERCVRELHMRPDAHVADFGAGVGDFSFALARLLHDKGTVCAIEIQQDLLTNIKRNAEKFRLNNIEIIWGDLDTVGGSTLNDASMDAVVVANLLFQVENRGAVVAEAFRILKPRGKILVIDWSESFGGLGPQAAHVITEDAAKQMFQGAGFTNLRSFPAGSHHYGFVAEKVAELMYE